MSVIIKQGGKVVLASHNQGKLKELKALMEPYDIMVYSSDALGLSEPVEDGETFEQNALIKARSACSESGMIAIADDSGLMVDALDGAPGVYSARWAGKSRDFSEAMDKLLQLLKFSDNRGAAFVSVIAVVFPTGEEYTFRGTTKGTITNAPKGSQGFGYDPIFIPETENRTFGEMPSYEKQLFSHRNKAFQQMLSQLMTS